MPFSTQPQPNTGIHIIVYILLEYTDIPCKSGYTDVLKFHQKDTGHTYKTHKYTPLHHTVTPSTSTTVQVKCDTTTTHPKYQLVK